MPWNVPQEHVEAFHPYDNPETGELLFEVVRFIESDRPRYGAKAKPRHRIGDRWYWGAGEWTGRSDAIPLYRQREAAAELSQGGRAFLCEGEKDVDRVFGAGAVGCCNAWGSDGFKSHHARALVEAMRAGEPNSDLVVVLDRDDAGMKRAERVRLELEDAGAPMDRVSFALPRSGKDVADHIDAGLSLGGLEPFQPSIEEDGFYAPILTEAEILADTPPDALVDRFIYRGALHNITGASKAGKSFLMTQAAICIATGSRFLGLDVQRAPVLFLNLEMTAHMVHKRIAEIAADCDLPMPDLGANGITLIAPTSGQRAPVIDLKSDGGRRGLRRLIQQTKPAVVILDTLHAFAAGCDHNDPATMGELFRWLNVTAIETGVGIVCLDYTTKAAAAGETSGPAAHSAFGTVLKGGACNVIGTLRRNGGAWSLNVDSHHGSWDDPIHYTRPKRSDGTAGCGAIATTLGDAKGITIERIRDLFVEGGQRTDEIPEPHFKSMRQLKEAIIAAAWTSNSPQAETLIRNVIEREHARRQNSRATATMGRPIEIRCDEDKTNSPKAYVWIARKDYAG